MFLETGSSFSEEEEEEEKRKAPANKLVFVLCFLVYIPAPDQEQNCRFCDQLKIKSSPNLHTKTPKIPHKNQEVSFTSSEPSCSKQAKQSNKNKNKNKKTVNLA